METDVLEAVRQLIAQMECRNECTENTMIMKSLLDAERWCVRLEQRLDKEDNDG